MTLKVRFNKKNKIMDQSFLYTNINKYKNNKYEKII
jgi:hypothetical protein